MSTLIIAAVVALLFGGLIGALLIRSLHPEAKQSRNLENRLQKAENQLKEYQQEVSEHFVETSRLVNSLTQSYRDVHEHLASGALKLTNPDISRQLLDAGKGSLMLSTDYTEKHEAEEESSEQPPRDWAPRDPSAKGQLSEDFGFDAEDNDAPQTERSSAS